MNKLKVLSDKEINKQIKICRQKLANDNKNVRQLLCDYHRLVLEKLSRRIK